MFSVYHFPLITTTHNCSFLFASSEIRKMQCLARDHSQKVFEENEKLRSELDIKRKELDERCKQLDQLVAQNDIEKQRLDDEKQKVAITSYIYSDHILTDVELNH